LFVFLFSVYEHKSFFFVPGNKKKKKNGFVFVPNLFCCFREQICNRNKKQETKKNLFLVSGTL